MAVDSTASPCPYVTPSCLSARSTHAVALWILGEQKWHWGIRMGIPGSWADLDNGGQTVTDRRFSSQSQRVCTLLNAWKSKHMRIFRGTWKCNKLKNPRSQIKSYWSLKRKPTFHTTLLPSGAYSTNWLAKPETSCHSGQCGRGWAGQIKGIGRCHGALATVRGTEARLQNRRTWWWLMPLTPTLGRLRHEGLDSKPV